MSGGPNSTRPPLAVVYGGGGPYATAFGMGVAAALLDNGVPLRSTPTLATSGGAWAAAAVFANLGHRRVIEVTSRIKLPDLRQGRLHGLAVELLGERHEPMLWTSTLRLPRLTRTLMWGGEHRVAEVVAASSSVPLMVPPQRVGRRYYIDGGARSWVSADLAPAADRLLVVAPGVSPALGPFGSALGRQLALEISRWKRRTGGQAYIVRPEHGLGRRIKRWGNLFDGELAREAYAGAHAQTSREIAHGGSLRSAIA